MFLIRFYRNRLSHLKRRPCCKYYPSCSEYALTAYGTHGFFKATALTVWRLLRCNPWSMGGVDYVPGTPERIDFLARKNDMRNANEKTPSKGEK